MNNNQDNYKDQISDNQPGREVYKQLKEENQYNEKMMKPGTYEMMDRLLRNRDHKTDVVEAQRQAAQEKAEWIEKHGDPAQHHQVSWRLDDTDPNHHVVRVGGYTGLEKPSVDYMKADLDVMTQTEPDDPLDSALPPPPVEMFPPCQHCGLSSCTCGSSFKLSDITVPKAIYASGIVSTIGVGTYAFLKAVNPNQFYY